MYYVLLYLQTVHYCHDISRKYDVCLYKWNKDSVNIMMESFSDEEEGEKSVISFAIYFKP